VDQFQRLEIHFFGAVIRADGVVGIAAAVVIITRHSVDVLARRGAVTDNGANAQATNRFLSK
jgi:hypothetical protein